MKVGRDGRRDFKLSVPVGNRALERPEFPYEEIGVFRNLTKN